MSQWQGHLLSCSEQQKTILSYFHFDAAFNIWVCVLNNLDVTGVMGEFRTLKHLLLKHFKGEARKATYSFQSDRLRAFHLSGENGRVLCLALASTARTFNQHYLNSYLKILALLRNLPFRSWDLVVMIHFIHAVKNQTKIYLERGRMLKSKWSKVQRLVSEDMFAELFKGFELVLGASHLNSTSNS